MSSPTNLAHARLTAIAGAVALAVAMGIGRFAFTSLLPFMQHDAGLGIEEGSWLASANYLGYLAGALSCLRVRCSDAFAVRTGLLATAVLSIAMGLTEDFHAWMVLRTLAGVASAWVLVFASVWSVRELAESGRPQWTSLVFASVGVGISVTGVLAIGFSRWQLSADAGWLIVGALALVLTLAIWKPLEARSPASHRAPATAAATVWSGEAIRLIAAYGAAGFGYIIAATFLPLIAREALGGSASQQYFWPLYGAAVVAAGALFVKLPTRLDTRLLLLACLVVQGIGNLAMALLPGMGGLLAGTLLVGGVFTTIVQLTMREARRIAPHNAGVLMGALTSAYGLGQILGPLLAAWCSRRFGGFGPSLEVAGIALLAGASLLLAPKSLGADRPVRSF